MSTSHSRRREGSGELDVFAATQYFSGEAYDSHGAARVRRKSLNMPSEAKVPQPQPMMMNDYHIKEKVKLKQPSSPSAKLSSFVNSLFQQYYSSKKKKSTKTLTKTTTTTAATANSHDNTKRRSKSNEYSSKSCYYSSSSKKREGEVWGDGFKLKINLNKKETNGFKEEVEDAVVDDDGETDSSSDLFELKNYDFYMNISRNQELPVYGSSTMEAISRGSGSTIAY